MKKRFLSLLLMLCMLTALMPITVGAESIQYVVAGSSYSLFGSVWTFTSESSNIMTEKNGKYELHLSPTEACGTVLLKVAKLTNGVVASNSDYYGDASGNNIEINVSGSGEILIVFDPSTHEITVSGDNVTMINGLQIDSMRTVGSGNGNWLNGVSWDPADNANLMTETSSGIYEITYTGIAAASDYEFKFAANGSWTDIWGGSINSEDAVYNGNNIIFDVKQDYSTVKMVFDFTNFDYATKTGAIYKLYVNNVQINASQTAEKNITLGTSALSGYDSTNNKYKYVYYGTYDNSPIKWRILSMNGNEGTYEDNNDETVSSENAMFLLSEYALKQMPYDSNGTKNDNRQTYVGSWRYSDVWNWCNTTFKSSSFTESERKYFLKTSKGEPRNNQYFDELEDDTFFFISTAEAEDIYNECENLRAYMAESPNGDAVWWWLRSPYYNNYVDCVNDHGFVDGSDVDDDDPAARPAFNLNLSSVLFTSAAFGGKSTAVGTLSANVENTDNEYKLTMKDSTRSGFTAKATDASGNIITVSYTNAKEGENEYISAIIVNADGEVTHYGKLANVENESGTATLDLTGITVASTDKVYIFNEQINGDYKTDFASELKEIAIKTNITLTKDKVSAYLVGNSATLIVASYKDKALKDVKTITVTSNIYEKTLAEIGLDTNGADSIKAFLWTDMENLTPLCEEQEVILNQSAS